MSLSTKLINSMGLTIVGMGVVFLVLIVLSFALDFLRVIVGQENKNKEVPSRKNAKDQESVEVSSIFPKEEEQEGVAVIAAAIAACQETTTENIRISSIKPIPRKKTVEIKAGS